MDRIAANLVTEVIETAEALADAAGKVILPYFRQHGLATENKATGAAFDPVTVADRAAERAMRDLLAQRRPNDAILGEEYGTSAGDSGLTWVLDPIDGTRGFMSGTPTWGVLIAVRDAQGPLYGVIDQPYTQERFRGGLGRAEFAGPHGAGALGTRTTGQLDQAILFTTFPEVGTLDDRAGFERVAAQVKLVRYGMDCYAYALLAAGQIDLVIEAGLQTYDIMAPIAVIEAAGGIVTNWEGGPVHEGGRAVAAATPQVHAAALDLLHTKG
ncbi:histidinol-phosphatase [Antarctobacter heliothermus]|uniref:Histidinol-phosphatase n=1 Tax=Antarctobacter heliothermus TaxID=74033 RepID=A0A239CMU4_9RHOB|nr:histidinol-phosphatase [Antarctobacter heliothermus]SNS21467.1 histidinol-phosphatase, inositol monophosphatase family [Antarctobacter heliothermus]